MPTTNKTCQSCKHFIRQNSLCDVKKSFAWDENGQCAKWTSTALDSLFWDMFGASGPFGDMFNK